MNLVCLLGRLTAEPELKHTQNQIPVTSFTLAVDRSYTPKGQERQADFINIVAWRQSAEFITRNFHKGQRMAVKGSLQSRRYTDRDGNNRTAYEVVVEEVYFADSKRESTSDSPPAPSYPSSAVNDFEEIDPDDDLPF